MSHPKCGGFVHSIKVPRIYKAASVIAKKVVEEGGSLKDLVYSSGHKNIKGVYALVVKAIQHNQDLEKLLMKSKLLKKESRLQPWLAKILMTELFFGKKELKGESKPVQTILNYKSQLTKFLKHKQNVVNNISSKVKKPRYVRVNTLHHTPDEIIKIFRKEGWSFVPTPNDYTQFIDLISNLQDDEFTRDFHIKQLLVFSGKVQFYENELYKNGNILLQDKASCLPGFLLKPDPDSVVLDMCAAPGMKTTHISAIMKNSGKIYATEMSSSRYKVLCDVIQTAGCINVIPLNVDALKLVEAEGSNNDFSWSKDVEYILVDPSCSGSGIVERVNIFENEKQDSKRLKKLCGFQYKLLLHALTNFPKVKRVVYSTCSVRTEENEGVVGDVIRTLNEFYSQSNDCDNEKKLHRFHLVESLKESWPHRGSKDYVHGQSCIFADPHQDLTNGFFIAVFERDDKMRCQKKS
ncbi:hypothetical protein RUM44_006851 [Polyplax serrata]|uniref:SAM-dependent MTase RsmB/NOP-type domain-containing protein n=1 Tax=Polyplax serrata TaxID=468196 RepID=A0ABR1AJ80_POLSC